MKSFKEIAEARYVTSTDFKLSPSGRKVHKMKKIADDETDEKDEKEVKEGTLNEYEAKDGVYRHQARPGRYGGSEKESDYVAGPSKKELDKIEAEKKKKKVKESTDLEEAVTVKKHDYSWGKMVTVHHGSENSYPLHPEHQAAIKKLKHGEKTSFKDETGAHVTAHREDDKVHLTHKGSNKKTTVAHSHFNESVELDEATDKQEQRILMLARLGLVDKTDVSKLRVALEQLKADKALTVQQRTLLLGVMSDLISLVTGDDTVFNRVKMDVQKEDYEIIEEESVVLESNDKDKDDTPPFDPDPKKPASAKAGKYGSGYSTARHLARLALQKQQQKKQK